MQLGVVIVRGESMEPTYRDGDRLLVLYGAKPQAGSVHVITLPDADDGPRPLAVKRITRQNGTDASGRPLWWVERDNPRIGVDSWLVGAIPDDHVHARVLWRLPRRVTTFLADRSGAHS